MSEDDKIQVWRVFETYYQRSKLPQEFRDSLMKGNMPYGLSHLYFGWESRIRPAKVAGPGEKLSYDYEIERVFTIRSVRTGKRRATG